VVRVFPRKHQIGAGVQIHLEFDRPDCRTHAPAQSVPLDGTPKASSDGIADPDPITPVFNEDD
jgi:hypothetical protein